jgi:hypothetical protein
MPRSRPAELRRAQRRGPTTSSPSVSLRVSRALDRLDRPDISSNKVALAFREWVAICSRPASDLVGEHNDWVRISGPISRGLLEQAMNALPRHLAREIRSQLQPWDERFLRMTIPYPPGASGPNWWRHRCGPG